MFFTKLPLTDDGEQEHINIVMDDMQESSTSSTVFTGGNKAASGTPGEQDEAFTISVCSNRDLEVRGMHMTQLTSTV